ncbi:DoxX family protein [Corynebacterium endometrii]|nr:DoxX family protein [Corynebacterium endometrii]
MNRPAVRDAALLLFRVVLGVVFLFHGVHKLFIAGMDATVSQFTTMGVPEPQLSAYVTVAAETVGGGMLIVGLLTTFVAGAMSLMMAGALYFAHLPNGFFVDEGGMEYVLVLIASLLMIVVFGAGRASLDEVLSRVEA